MNKTYREINEFVLENSAFEQPLPFIENVYLPTDLQNTAFPAALNADQIGALRVATYLSQKMQSVDENAFEEALAVSLKKHENFRKNALQGKKYVFPTEAFCAISAPSDP